MELWEHDDESLNENSCLGEVVQVEHDQREISRFVQSKLSARGSRPCHSGKSNIHPWSLANQNHGAVQYNALTEDKSLRSIQGFYFHSVHDTGACLAGFQKPFNSTEQSGVILRVSLDQLTSMGSLSYGERNVMSKYAFCAI